MKRDVAVILLYDDNKKILLQHRTEDAPVSPGNWAFFGGGIQPGETPEQTVIRETTEELSYGLTNPALVMTQPFTRHTEDTEKSLKYVFVEKYDPKQTLFLGEGQGMDWYSIEETSKLKMMVHDREVLQAIKNTL